MSAATLAPSRASSMNYRTATCWPQMTNSLFASSEPTKSNGRSASMSYTSVQSKVPRTFSPPLDPSPRNKKSTCTSLFAPPVLTPSDVFQQKQKMAVGETRTTTPPPSTKKIEDDDECFSISTVNMSPFMVLRIKALIELASIADAYGDSDDEQIELKVGPVQPLKPCLKSTTVCDETARLERQLYEMDSEERCINLLNDLLENSRQTHPPPSINEVNEMYKQYIRDSDQVRCMPKLSFSEGASLLCFDSAEKPRKVKDNHTRHFAKFLAYQKRANVQGTSLEPPMPPQAPPPLRPQPSPRVVPALSLGSIHSSAQPSLRRTSVTPPPSPHLVMPMSTMSRTPPPPLSPPASPSSTQASTTSPDTTRRGSINKVYYTATVQH
eukprot:Blabericola_migrator_1__6465@NODE_325_length_9793_cov_271_773288_g262_i0_p2_GENE_NODE_325_length_9793_cov_271_773288_g262_i0NODE_325_length_9793_cov_271_773288_g262_i0_p2_ORF_typecomplete_len382_score39_08_NODE_325_length_9793_cov_271_773288_g262_i0541199